MPNTPWFRMSSAAVAARMMCPAVVFCVKYAAIASCKSQNGAALLHVCFSWFLIACMSPSSTPRFMCMSPSVMLRMSRGIVASKLLV